MPQQGQEHGVGSVAVGPQLHVAAPSGAGNLGKRRRRFQGLQVRVTRQNRLDDGGGLVRMR